MKKRSLFVAGCVLMLILVTTATTQVAFAEEAQLYITYDELENVKTINNIASYLQMEKSKSKTHFNERLVNLLAEIGYSEDEIFDLPTTTINEIVSSTKIYSYSQTYDLNQEKALAPNQEEIFEHSKFTLKFTVVDLGIVNSRRTYKVMTKVDWFGSNPAMRGDDIISMAWSNNAMHNGSTYVNGYIKYLRNQYSNGKLIESKTITNNLDRYNSDSNKILRVLEGIEGANLNYKMPANSLIPYYLYSNIELYSEAQITASGDFVIQAGYGHQVTIGKPSVSVGKTDVSVSISFDNCLDKFYSGVIRVNS